MIQWNDVYTNLPTKDGQYLVFYEEDKEYGRNDVFVIAEFLTKTGKFSEYLADFYNYFDIKRPLYWS